MSTVSNIAGPDDDRDSVFGGRVSPTQRLSISPNVQNDDEWESLSHTSEHLGSPSSQSPSPNRSRRRKLVRRNLASVMASPSTSRQGQLRSRKSAIQKQNARDSAIWWPQVLADLAFSSFVFVVDIIINALKLLKLPLTLLLAVYILSFLMSHLYLAMKTPLTSTLSAVCQLPGISLLGSEFCQELPAAKTKKWTQVDYPKLMEIETQSFEKLLDNSVASTDLILDLKKAEMASTDLNTILLASDLQIKEYLSTAIREFVDVARGTGRALQRLDAKIEGTVEQITTFNEYTMQTILSISPSQQSLPLRLLRSALLLPKRDDNQIHELFDQVMSILESHLERLLLEGQQALQCLDRLEERLTAIHLIVAQEDDKVAAAKQELLAELWSILGGNKRQLAKYNRHIDILRSIDTARQRALAHVVAAVTTVESTQASLEDLRERASRPGLVHNIPLEAHILSMKAGVERISTSRKKVGQVKGEALGTLRTIAD